MNRHMLAMAMARPLVAQIEEKLGVERLESPQDENDGGFAGQAYEIGRRHRLKIGYMAASVGALDPDGSILVSFEFGDAPAPAAVIIAQRPLKRDLWTGMHTRLAAGGNRGLAIQAAQIAASLDCAGEGAVTELGAPAAALPKLCAALDEFIAQAVADC